jgi:TrwC relaxase/Phage integrase family
VGGGDRRRFRPTQGSGPQRRECAAVRRGPKTWSVAAALHPDISAALDDAQDQAASEIIGWVARHATTRVGPRGRQVQVPVERIEAAVIRHYTSRAGDPHRHLHLQVNARVFAAGSWRGLHSVGIRDSIEAINGIGHATVATDPKFRSVLRVSTFRTAFTAAARAIGVPDLHPHQLRHTAASLAIASGADVKVVQQMLGHSSATMTLDTYGHHFEDRLDEVGDAMDRGPDPARRPACCCPGRFSCCPSVARARFRPK